MAVPLAYFLPVTRDVAQR